MHPDVTIYLDRESASELDEAQVAHSELNQRW
jgi:hypothetical protein